MKNESIGSAPSAKKWMNQDGRPPEFSQQQLIDMEGMQEEIRKAIETQEYIEHLLKMREKTRSQKGFQEINKQIITQRESSYLHQKYDQLSSEQLEDELRKIKQETAVYEKDLRAFEANPLHRKNPEK